MRSSSLDETDMGPSATTLSDRGQRRVFVVAAVASVLIRVFFWVYTDRVWEDCLITTRHAENAALGNGLTHHPAHGAPVHGFTSPISVLVPLLGELIVRGAGLATQRIATLIATLITMSLAYRIARHPDVDLAPVGTAFFLGYLALEHHQILFGMAGMETQCIVAITLFGMWQFLTRQTVGMGVACGLALWGRPDGVVLILATVCALLMSRQWRRCVAVILLAVVVIAPWLIFTTAYYGSPVPNTIVAKSTVYSGFFFDEPGFSAWWERWGSALLARADNLRIWLSPSFGGMGAGTINFVRGARPIQAMFVTVLLIGGVAMLRNSRARMIPIYVFGFFAYLVIMVPVAGAWYLPPWLGACALVFAGGIEILCRARFRIVRLGSSLAAVGLLCLYVVALTRTIPAERIIQRAVEDDVRTRSAKWLAEHSEVDEWIGCECLGYFGYYSNRPILDFPGLACPRSVNALRRLPKSRRDLPGLIASERPEWIALRPWELRQLSQAYPDVRSVYRERQRFTADSKSLERVVELLWLTNAEILVDREFILLQRTSDNSGTDASGP